MDKDEHWELLDRATGIVRGVIQRLVMRPDEPDGAISHIERLSGVQDLLCQEFPVLSDEADFWEAVWLRTDRLRRCWDRIERVAGPAGKALPAKLQPTLNCRRSDLYAWTHDFICRHAPSVPTAAHFELGIDVRRPDRRGLHERIEGLYESIKRMGRLPEVRVGLELCADRVNFGIIYGGGWNVSSFSVLREAAGLSDMNAFVTFDHPGAEFYGRVGMHEVRLATAGLLRAAEPERYLLARFSRPVILHFVCPHEWSGPPPHELGLPVLRSGLTLEVVDDKLNSTRALEWYARSARISLPLIPETGVPRAEAPVDLHELGRRVQAAIDVLERQGNREVVVKPARGEQAQDVRFFELPAERAAAAGHAVGLALESGAVLQKRVRPPGGEDFNWRVLVALDPSGEPEVVGRFARRGYGDDVEMVPEREMFRRCGIGVGEGDALLVRIDEVSLHAFRAVAGYAKQMHPDFPWQPLGGGSYAVPYFLGIDLIGEACIMEINGNEVAGMWTDDRLYPQTRGRSSRTVLESARAAARAYKAALSAQA